MKKFKKAIQVGLLLGILMPAFALAQNDIPGNNGQTIPGSNNSTNIDIKNPITCSNGETGCNDLVGVLGLLLRNVVGPIAAVLVTLYIIYAGFTFVTAQGNPGEIQKAKQRLLWALIGAAILLGAAGIAEVVKTTVNQVTGL